MNHLIAPLVLLVAFAAWIVAEVRAGVGPRVLLGVLWMGLMGLAWLSTEQRAAISDAYHQALLREIGKNLEAGELEHVKRAVRAYNHPNRGAARVYQALDAMLEKGD